MKKITILMLFSVLLLSCKIKNEDTENDSVQTFAKYGFKVTAKVISKKTDDFCLLYTEDGSINFGESVVWKPVPGSINEQNVEFFLPEDRYPTQLRMDLGLKQSENDTIFLKSIQLDYNGKKVDIVGQQLGQYFRADENHCKFDPITGSIVPIIKDGKAQHPSIYPHEIELDKLLKRLASSAE
jgi:hypothetical protein